MSISKKIMNQRKTEKEHLDWIYQKKKALGLDPLRLPNSTKIG